MRFKTLFSLLTMIFFQISCSDYLNGSKPRDEVRNLDVTRFECLHQIMPVIEEYIQGESESGKISNSALCLREAVSYFRDRTRGTTTDIYTSEDLQKFFNTYLLKTNQITPELAREIFKVKIALVGGSGNHITKVELNQIIDQISAIEKLLLKILNITKIIFLKTDNENLPQDTHTNAFSVLRQSLRDFFAQSEFYRSDYALTDLKNLIVEIQKLDKSDTPKMNLFKFGSGAGLAPLRLNDFLDLMFKVKDLFFGEFVNFPSRQHWNYATDQAVSLWETVSFYHFYLPNISVGNPVFLRRVSLTVEKLTNVFSFSYAIKFNGKIDLNKIDELLVKMLELKYLTFPFSFATIRETYRKVLGGMLDPAGKNKPRDLLYLEEVHIKNFRREYLTWRLNQTAIDKIYFKNDVSLSFSEVKKSLSNLDKNQLISEIELVDFSKQEALVNLQEFLSLILRSRAVVFDMYGRLRQTYDYGPELVSWSSLARLNLVNLMTRGLMLGYSGQEKNLNQTQVFEKDLIRFYDDFYSFGVEAGAFDPRSGNAGARSLKEANLFTISGDGNQSISYIEASELIGFLLAGGMNLTEPLVTKIDQIGCTIDNLGKDSFGKPYFYKDCYKKALRAELKTFFNSSPFLVDYIAKLNDKAWDEYFQLWYLAAATNSSDPNRVEFATIRTQVMIAIYSENLFMMFDLNRDGLLNYQEVLGAAPRFYGIISEIVYRETQSLEKAKDIELLKDVFCFLVFEGRKPTTVDMIKLKMKKWFGPGFTTTASRMNLVKVFQYFKNESAN